MAKKTEEPIKVYDYTENRDGKGIKLIVRPNNTYVIAQAGEHVIVDKVELNNHSTMSCCMTFEEAAEIKKEIERQEAEALRRIKQGSSLKRSVDAALAQLTENALKTAKDKAKSETLESEKIARKEILSNELLGGE